MSNGNETADTIHNAGKMHLVDSVRVMADNQRTLNRTNAEDQQLRDLHVRTEEAMAQSRIPDLADPKPSVEEEDMRINVDSPTTTTVNHHYESAQAAPPGSMKSNLLAKAAPLLLAGALGASGVGIPWLLASLGGAAAEAVVDADTQYLLELVPSDASSGE